MRRAVPIGPLLKSAVFLVATVLATATLGVSIAATGVGRSHTYKARFTDVTGLAVGDSVRIAGVPVGRVEAIRVVDHRLAEVAFSVAADRELPQSTTAAVNYLDLVGQRYLDLEQGAGALNQHLVPGATIPLEHTRGSLDLTQLFDGFQPLFEGLDPNAVNQLSGEIIQVLQGDGTTVDSLLGHLASLTTTLAAKDRVVGEVIDNLTKVTDTVDTDSAGLQDLVATLQKLVSGFAADRDSIGGSISALGDLTTSTAALLQDGRPALRDSLNQLGRLSTTLGSGPQLNSFLQNTPTKLAAVGRLASYGSWLNLFLCQATVTGVTTSNGSPPPTGIPSDQVRCRG